MGAAWCCIFILFNMNIWINNISTKLTILNWPEGLGLDRSVGALFSEEAEGQVPERLVWGILPLTLWIFLCVCSEIECFNFQLSLYCSFYSVHITTKLNYFFQIFLHSLCFLSFFSAEVEVNLLLLKKNYHGMSFLARDNTVLVRTPGVHTPLADTILTNWALIYHRASRHT